MRCTKLFLVQVPKVFRQKARDRYGFDLGLARVDNACRAGLILHGVIRGRMRPFQLV
jgi:hypothetical protein